MTDTDRALLADRMGITSAEVAAERIVRVSQFARLLAEAHSEATAQSKTQNGGVPAAPLLADGLVLAGLGIALALLVGTDAQVDPGDETSRAGEAISSAAGLSGIAMKILGELPNPGDMLAVLASMLGKIPGREAPPIEAN